MAAAVERFLEAARRHGLAPRPERYPDGTRTAADAAAAIGCSIDQIVKSMVLVTADGPVMALVSGAHRAALPTIASHLGVDEVRTADAAEVRAATGYAIGGVPPFGYPEPLRTLMDPHLLTFDRVYAAAGTPHDNFGIDPDDLRAVTAAEVVDLAEAPA